MSRLWSVVPAAVALSFFVAGCDEPPTAPRAVARPAIVFPGDPPGAPIPAQDLGVLPGDLRSEATYVTEDGVVYGRSYATESSTPVRFFRWTAGGGMVQVSSIPQPPARPLPSLAPPRPAQAIFVAAANAKGEATGQLCYGGCNEWWFQWESQNNAHAFRSTPGRVVHEIDGRLGYESGEFFLLGTSHGWSINEWGHIAGSYWVFDGADPIPVFWTPVDSFQFVGAGVMSVEFTDTRLNELDQVIGRIGGFNETRAFVWRPDLGTRSLAMPDESHSDESSETRALAQQIRGTLVVGRSWVFVGNHPDFPDSPDFRVHAALWRVPAVNRVAFPSVNAKLYTSSSRIRLINGSVLYYVTYKATQATASGPYTEVVDWGDGTSSRRTRASLSPIYAAKHTYTAPGVYWVRVYVKDSQGRWGVDERKVTVTQ